MYHYIYVLFALHIFVCMLSYFCITYHGLILIKSVASVTMLINFHFSLVWNVWHADIYQTLKYNLITSEQVYTKRGSVFKNAKLC